MIGEDKETCLLEMNNDLLKSIAVECTIFSFNKGALEILLIPNNDDKNNDKWTLPGYWKTKENLDNTVRRLLKEVIGMGDVYFEQLKIFVNPNCITAGYFILLNREDFSLTANLLRSGAEWFNVKNIPELLDNHKEIFFYGLNHLREKAKQTPIVSNILPDKFTMPEFQKLYEEILNIKLDKGNFRKKILKMNILIKLNEMQWGSVHRNAILYQFDTIACKKITAII